MKNVKKLITLILACGMLLGLCLISEAATPKLSQNKMLLTVGSTAKLTVKNGDNKTVTWKSSNKKVATVSSTGKVKAIKAGEAKITAKVGDKKLQCKVGVLKNTPMLSETNLELAVGETGKIEVLNAKNKKVTWSSSKKSVATVSSKGKVKAKKTGTAKITAKVGNKKLTCKVKVEEVPDSATAQAVLSKTVWGGQSATVVTGNRVWGLIFMQDPKIKITNTGSRYLNVYVDNNFWPLKYQLRPGWSITKSFPKNTTHTVYITDVFGMGSRDVQAVVSSANNGINRIY